MRTGIHEYLQTFFEIELEWIADPVWQHKSWSDIDGEMFGDFLMTIYESWSVIKDHRQEAKLTNTFLGSFSMLLIVIDALLNKSVIFYTATIRIAG
jgi:hypothetical protein